MRFGRGSNQYSPVREHIILELKAICEQYRNWSLDEKVFQMIRFRTTIEDAISLQEMALSALPSDVVTTKKGREPSRYALNLISDALTRLRRYIKNDCIVPYAIRKPNGEWVYFCMQRKAEFYDTLKREQRIKKGMTQNADKMLWILAKKPAMRRKLSELLSDELEQKRFKRLKKKRAVEIEV